MSPVLLRMTGDKLINGPVAYKTYQCFKKV